MVLFDWFKVFGLECTGDVFCKHLGKSLEMRDGRFECIGFNVGRQTFKAMVREVMGMVGCLWVMVMYAGSVAFEGEGY